ncbi:hypothetical protein FJQ98_14905 [Lysinibacillus agricola]|uniref:Uncharacterized protein n=1 Tax=Lysinibacillus agricola TaxID=2590012 RepID=A0ABX7ANT0_9BACI|nr:MULTISPECIES: hypothetical protein [Lysinibacillus]QQP10563.1 hypothetical protein FJQ98_14905 [Lysinibacillus agricola]
MKVGKIANMVFMLGDTINHFDLRGAVLRQLNKWFSSSTARDNALVNNAMMGAILVPNAKGYGFEVDGEMFEISRDILIAEMESILPTLPQGNDLLDEEKVKVFLANTSTICR